MSNAILNITSMLPTQVIAQTSPTPDLHATKETIVKLPGNLKKLEDEMEALRREVYEMPNGSERTGKLNQLIEKIGAARNIIIARNDPSLTDQLHIYTLKEATFLLQLGRPQQEVKAKIEEVLTQETKINNPKVLIILTKLLYVVGSNEQANEVLLKAEKLLTTMNPSTDLNKQMAYEDLVELGSLLARIGQYDRALQLKSSPVISMAHMRRDYIAGVGHAAIVNEDFDVAFEIGADHLPKVTNERFFKDHHYKELGSALIRAEKHTQAIEAFSRLSNHEPDKALGFASIAGAMTTQDSRDEVLQTFTRALEAINEHNYPKDAVEITQKGMFKRLAKFVLTIPSLDELMPPYFKEVGTKHPELASIAQGFETALNLAREELPPPRVNNTRPHYIITA